MLIGDLLHHQVFKIIEWLTIASKPSFVWGKFALFALSLWKKCNLREIALIAGLKLKEKLVSLYIA